MTRRSSLPVTIVGAGQVGCALAVGLKSRGHSVRYVASRNRNSARFVGRIVHARFGPLDALPRPIPPSIYFLAVPDDEIHRVTAQLARMSVDFSGSVAFHCSGALASDVLQPLREKGAAVGSLHPLQTFAARKGDATLLEHIWFGLEGDRRAVSLGRDIVRELQSRVILLQPEQKALYHIAAVFASNYFVTLLSVVEDIGGKLGLSRRQTMLMFGPIIQRTLENVKEKSAAAALTGPIARGDVRTLRRHRSALRTSGEKSIARLYETLAEHTQRLAGKKNA